MIRYYLNKLEMSVYQCSKLSGIPYATVNDLYNHKTPIEKCKAGTLYRVCRVLGVSSDDVLKYCLESRIDFDNFRSTICQNVKTDEIAYIDEQIRKDEISIYLYRGWNREALYLLGMLDYLCHKHNLSLYSQYDEIRRMKLEQPVYPKSILALSYVLGPDILQKAEEKALPEFMMHNIVESEVESVA